MSRGSIPLRSRGSGSKSIRSAGSAGLALLLTAAAPTAFAFDYGPFQITGFAKDEYSVCDNCSKGLVNPSPYDPRGVLSQAPDPPLNQGGESGTKAHNLGLAMLSTAFLHEFDNAIRIEARATARERNNAADIYGNYLIDLYAGVTHPHYGTVQVGKFATRSWSRADSFAYPIGLSVPWAESGAGYGIVPDAVRYQTREYELDTGKLRLEATWGWAKKRPPLNPTSTVSGEGPPSPHMLELFAQYSNEKNLVELIFQQSTGGIQSSFAKGAFYGAQGNTNAPMPGVAYREPEEDVAILQGNYWYNEHWRLAYGLKRSEWSGQQQQCDYGPVSPIASACFWDQAGFNYASDGRIHHAIEWDAMLGIAYTRALWTYTLGGVQMNKAYVRQPTEWGQSNTATFVNLGAYRKLPELSKHLEVYGGLGRVMYGRQGPAPLSMPSNTADGGVDPRVSISGNTITLGANFIF